MNSKTSVCLAKLFLFALGVVNCGCGESFGRGKRYWLVQKTDSQKVAEPEPDTSKASEPDTDVSDDAGTKPAPIPKQLAKRGNIVSCDIKVDAELSKAIGTVGIVTWSTDLKDLDSANIEFGLSDTGVSMLAPVDLKEADYRTLLLGMKGDREYVFHVVANAGKDTCVSEDQFITTQPVSDTVPQLDITTNGDPTPGFLVLSNGVNNLALFGGSSGADAPAPAYIIDSDGDVVWWWDDAPSSTGRARMDWEGKYMYMVAVNVFGGMGDFRGVSMDGLERNDPPEDLQEAHHDFAVAPGGVLFTMVHNDDCSAIKEWSPKDGVKTIVSTVEDIYKRSGDCHPNSILYHPDTDTLTISDRNPNLYVKIKRDGTLLWQFGGSDPLGASFDTTVTWTVNHGHHLLENNHIVFFNNGPGQDPSAVLEFELDESTWTATEVWQYTSEYTSPTLGDVQRLDSGNTLVTYSNAGVIEEVSPKGKVIRSISTDSLGYAMHRSTLYGAPPK